jgi:hypothetical protein
MRGENDKEAKTNGIIQNIEGYKKYRRKGADIRNREDHSFFPSNKDD